MAATDLNRAASTLYPGGTGAAFAINASGQVVGVAVHYGNGDAHATLWNGTTATDLGTLGGSYSVGRGINASGQVVGYSYTAGDVRSDPFLYISGQMIDILTSL